VVVGEALAASSPERPTHCRAAGTIGGDIRFVVLRPDQWNGKFFMGGGGGFVGAVENSAEFTLAQGYATAGTDTGHQDGEMSGRWALGHPERLVNFGHVAVHRTAETAKALIHAYYGTPSQKNYFLGCSRGGSQGVMEAIRYPEDFDGIVAGAPSLDWTGLAGRVASDVRVVFPEPLRPESSLLPPAVTKRVESAILAQCDRVDGVQDGLMTDPRRCTFNLASIPTCGSGAEVNCLTDRQRRALTSIYSPLRDDAGEIYPGRPFGGEGDLLGWPAWLTGIPEGIPGVIAPGLPPPLVAYGLEFFRYFVHGNPSWMYDQFDLRSVRSDTQPLATVLNANNPDLRRFKAEGGRMILYHGWSDPVLSALGSIDYYDQVQATDRDLRTYFRMFLMPGVFHCGLGPGPDNTDWVSAIVQWVENDVAPDRILSRKVANGSVVRTRPLCPYPQRAEYVGRGSTDDEVNFVCR
jgi:feruloyl esterase